jgi:hypothetical protein
MKVAGHVGKLTRRHGPPTAERGRRSEMLNSKRVVAWTPFGRLRTVSVLVEYLRREHERGIVDEYWMFLNTDPDQVEDLRYAYELEARYTWVRLLERPDGLPRRTPKQRNTTYAYRYMTDRDTVYIRLDDDIIYLHEDAIARLAKAKLEMRPTLCCHAMMWNNAITSWFLQQAGVIPFEFDTGGRQMVRMEVGAPYCMDAVGWASGDFAVAIHELLLDWVEAGEPERAFLYQDMPLQLGQQFSVSAFASLGEDYANLPRPGVLEPDEEEHWHTVHQPKVIGSPNIIVGNAVVSHYTFAPQRRAVLATNILDRYRALAGKLT